MKEISVIILAGGKGTRMGGDVPKVLKLLSGKPLIHWILDLLKAVGASDVVVVTCYKEEVVRSNISENGYSVKFVSQGKALGTAHAVKKGLKAIDSNSTNTLVLYGDDSSLYNPKSIDELINLHIKTKSKITLMTIMSNVPTALGGLEIDSAGRVIDVLSQNDMIVRKIKENNILCGALVFETKWLKNNISKIKKGRIKGEYPLPAIISIAASQGNYANRYVLSSENEWNSINTPDELSQAQTKIINKK